MLLFLLAACGRDVSMPAAPEADPTRRWERALRAVVTPDGRVDYDALRARRADLEAFVGYIGDHGPETDGMRLLDDDRRLAWHLNAYNALVLYGVLLVEPIASVRDVPAPAGPPGTGFFWWWRFRIDRERMSLHWYEQGLIFPTYQEPLAHAALNCASVSCPPMRDELYRAKDLDAQLRDQMQRWVTGGGAVVEEGDGFVFNAIFDWYADHFRDYAGADTPCAAVRPYADAALAAALDARPACPHRFAPYDWSLNGAIR